MIANVNRGKDTPAFHPGDFFPSLVVRKPMQKPEDAEAALDLWFKV